MEKRVKILIIVLFLIMPFVNAGSIGISPAGTRIFFEPNLERTYDYKVFVGNQNQKISIYVGGDLAQYVTLDKKVSYGNTDFRATLKLPPYIEVPGNHRIVVGAVEAVPDDSDPNMVAGLAAVQSPIDIFVPYPGKYAEVTFDILNTNKGEKVNYTIFINNLGTESINPKTKIEIYKDEKYTDKLLTETIDFGEIASKEKITKSRLIDTANFDAGFYYAVLTFNYEHLIILNKTFRIGIFDINITDYSYKFEAGKINKFYVSIESLFNNEIKNIYGHIKISDNGKLIDEFKSSSVNLMPFEKFNLTGFFDTTNVSAGKYTANIMIKNENISIYKLVKIYVENPIKKDDNLILYVVIGIGSIIALCLIVIIILIILLLKSRNNNNKKIKGKNKK